MVFTAGERKSKRGHEGELKRIRHRGCIARQHRKLYARDEIAGNNKYGIKKLVNVANTGIKHFTSCAVNKDTIKTINELMNV